MPPKHQNNIKGTILFYGGKARDRDGMINNNLKSNNLEYTKNNPDILILKEPKNKESIGIDQVRRATKFLGQKPYMSKTKYLIIKNAHSLTRQAQNALLKTLEEPPGYANIILETENKNELLETVLSRCQQIKIRPTVRKNLKTNSLGKIKNLSNGKKLELAEKLTKKSRGDVGALIESWIAEERSELKSEENNKMRKNAQNLKILEKVRNDLNTTNVNSQIALEFLLLKLS